MSLLYKEDWGDSKKRYLAWWEREIVDRCMLAIQAPKRGTEHIKKPQPPSDQFEVNNFDLDYIEALTEYNHQTTFYGGDAYPKWPDANCQLYGNFMLADSTEVKSGSIWSKPILTDEHIDYQKIQLDPKNRWYQFGLELARVTAKKAKGKAIPFLNGFYSVSDCLAELRGSDELLFDFYDRPEEVIAAENHLRELGMKAYQDLVNVVEPLGQGYCNFLTAWAPESYSMVQHDFSYMLSPEMFEEIFLPSVQKQVSQYDYTLSHVDGIGNFGHVPALCEIPELKAIQILPGAGQPSPLHYEAVLKEVQHAGKSLHITIPPHEVEDAMKMLSLEGLMITTDCASEEEAIELEKMVGKWSAIYR